MKMLLGKNAALLVGLLCMVASCGETAPKDLELTQEVELSGFGLTAKIPADWKIEEETTYDGNFSGYLIRGKRDRIRIEEKEGNCFTETSVDEFAKFMDEQSKSIDAKAIPAGKERTPDRFVSKEVLKYKNGAYGLVYENEFTTTVDGSTKLVQHPAYYVFNIKNKEGKCIQVENTSYNNDGETLPTDLKIIQSIH
ncbi:hypothetical protein [Aureispira anguillae]|uniref:Lipoprotein n=1 Tax=Aureispira anguillae TaxID=2864201 RepID=A0A915VKH1_9BACT|nr:hypothetical protein [Aureispira anguillae]BDS09671.1 hypothetical protein AsAng_0003750 [Aureispira anguillae]